jgi:hypothetical protein
MTTPYNTGKVKIGIYYEKPRYCEYDKDMLALQGWLIGDREASRRLLLAKVFYAVALIVVFAILILKK